MVRTGMGLCLLTLSLLALPVTAMAGQDAHHDAHSDAADHADARGGHGDAHHGALHLVDVLTNVEFLGSVVNFALLLGVLVWLGRKPLRQFLTTRRKAVEDGMAEAARMKAEAEAKYKEYADRLAKLDEEVKRLSGEIVAAAEEEKRRIIQEAETSAARQRQDAENLIQQQMKQLYTDVMAEVADKAVAAAESVIQQGLQRQDQDRLAREYLARITETAKREDRL